MVLLGVQRYQPVQWTQANEAGENLSQHLLFLLLVVGCNLGGQALHSQLRPSLPLEDSRRVRPDHAPSPSLGVLGRFSHCGQDLRKALNSVSAH